MKRTQTWHAASPREMVVILTDIRKRLPWWRIYERRVAKQAIKYWEAKYDRN